MISDTQQEMVEYIRDYIAVHGYSPTVREIGNALDISSTSTVDYNLRVLQAVGKIKRQPKIARSVRLVTS